MTPAEEEAVRAAVAAVRRYQRAGRTGQAGWSGTSAVDVLEARLGPLDWSRFDSRAYRLLRVVRDRIFGVRRPERTDKAGDRALALYDRMESGRRRLAVRSSRDRP